MTDPRAIDPTKPWLNIKWSVQDVEVMHRLWKERLDPVQIAGRFSKVGRPATAREVCDIADRNGFWA